jgi:hypothetical protein
MRYLRSTANTPTPIGEYADQAQCGYISVQVIKPTDIVSLIWLKIHPLSGANNSTPGAQRPIFRSLRIQTDLRSQRRYPVGATRSP